METMYVITIYWQAVNQHSGKVAWWVRYSDLPVFRDRDDVGILDETWADHYPGMRDEYLGQIAEAMTARPAEWEE